MFSRWWQQLSDEERQRLMEEWKRGLEYLRQALGISPDKEGARGTEHVCPKCGKTTKRPTTIGLCLRCFEEELNLRMRPPEVMRDEGRGTRNERQTKDERKR
jgi:hypothetical protein